MSRASEGKTKSLVILSDGPGQPLSIMSFSGRLREEMAGPDGCIR